ncbi:MAG TPA: hypothetical protein VFO65_10700, partial [Acidimicrobiales bacterium]|nr:hypothetical protein [Acidimicrobiales bacterium]
MTAPQPRRWVRIPELADFAFGSLRGPVEEAAVRQIARLLAQEAGVDDTGGVGDTSGAGHPGLGDLGHPGDPDDPDGPGPEAAAAIVRDVLDGPVADLDRTVQAAIEHERLVAWAASAGPDRAGLVDDLLADLARPAAGELPAAPTEEVDQMLAGVRPLGWLVDAVGDGVALERGAPPVSLLRDLAVRAGWPASRRALGADLAGSEPRVVVWVGFHAGLVEPRGDRLAATPAGRSLAPDPGRLWHHLCRRALAVAHPTVAALELGLALLVRDGPAPPDELGRALLPLARQEGLAIGVALDHGRLRRDPLGDPVTGPLDDRAAARWAGEVVRLIGSLGSALGMLAPARGPRAPLALTAAGRRTALALLRGRAVAARHETELAEDGPD